MSGSEEKYDCVFNPYWFESANIFMAASGVSFPPLRSLEEFAFGDAQFSSPPSDLNKWSKRVYKNMLYFQSNYFLLFSIIFLFVCLLYPHSIIVGVLVAAGVILFGKSVAESRKEMQEFKQQHPLLFLLAMFALCLVIFSIFGALVAFTFGFALPLSAIFIHASTRVPGLKNKLFSKTEELSFRRSPIGLLLNALDERLESFVVGDS